jgi:uncharacterized spore protein YtfJ
MSENRFPDTDFSDITSSEDVLDVIQDTMDTFLGTAGVHRVYAEPITHEETVIIPASEVIVGMGFGVGYGSGSGQRLGEDEEENEEDESGDFAGGGGGGGGGGRTFSRPVAVVVASPRGVRVEPVVDVTKIGLAFLTAAGFMAASLMRMLNPQKGLKELKGK